MMDTMDRMMEDPLVYNNGNGQPRSESGRYNRTPWEIKEGQGDYKMRFDMPGMTKQDVKVWVEEKMLVVKAEKKIENGEAEGEKQEEEEVWPAKGFGKYSFRIALPENIEYEKIKAEVKDGVLYINVPKASVSSKVLDINVE